MDKRKGRERKGPTFANQFEDLEVFRSIVFLVCLVETHLKVDLAGYILLRSAALKLEPSLKDGFVFAEIWA